MAGWKDRQAGRMVVLVFIVEREGGREGGRTVR